MAGIITVINRQPGFNTVNVNICQVVAVNESTTPDAGHTIRDGDAGQAAAVSESIFSDAGNTVRDGDAGQFGIADKEMAPG